MSVNSWGEGYQLGRGKGCKAAQVAGCWAAAGGHGIITSPVLAWLHAVAAAPTCLSCCLQTYITEDERAAQVGTTGGTWAQPIFAACSHADLPAAHHSNALQTPALQYKEQLNQLEAELQQHRNTMALGYTVDVGARWMLLGLRVLSLHLMHAGYGYTPSICCWLHLSAAPAIRLLLAHPPLLIDALPPARPLAPRRAPSPRPPPCSCATRCAPMRARRSARRPTRGCAAWGRTWRVRLPGVIKGGWRSWWWLLHVVQRTMAGRPSWACRLAPANRQPPTADKFAEIVKLRNKLARVAGYKDYYAMKLEQAEGFGMDVRRRAGADAAALHGQRSRGETVAPSAGPIHQCPVVVLAQPMTRARRPCPHPPPPCPPGAVWHAG